MKFARSGGSTGVDPAEAARAEAAEAAEAARAAAAEQAIQAAVAAEATARQQADATLQAEIAALPSGPTSGLSQAVADARYRRQIGLIDRLPLPVWVMHRCNGVGGLPEETIEAAEVARGRGFLLDFDLWALSDGTLVPMHDGTVDRTTMSTGNISSFTLAQWRALLMRTLNGFPTNAQYNPPTWDDVLNRYGGVEPISVETKAVNIADAFIASVVSRGLQRDIMHTSFNYADCKKVLAAGIPSALQSDTQDPVQYKADGFSWIYCSATATNAYVASHVAQGTKVGRYTYSYANAANAAIAGGASLLFSDNADWVTQRYPRIDRDQFYLRRGWPGWNCPAGFGFVRDEFGGGLTGQAGVTATIPFYNFASPGTTGRWRWRLRWIPTASTAGSVGLFVGTVSSPDNAYSIMSGGAQSTNGYQGRMARDGSILLDKVTGGLLATTSSDATSPAVDPTTEATFDLQLEITSTGVTFTNLTTGKYVVLNDTQYRTNSVLSVRWTTANAYLSKLSVEAL